MLVYTVCFVNSPSPKPFADRLDTGRQPPLRRSPPPRRSTRGARARPEAGRPRGRHDAERVGGSRFGIYNELRPIRRWTAGRPPTSTGATWEILREPAGDHAHRALDNDGRARRDDAVDIVTRRRQVPFTEGVKSIGVHYMSALELSKDQGPHQVDAARSE